MAYRTSPAHLDPVAGWLAETFPHQQRLNRDIGADLRRCPELPLEPPNAAVFGYIAEFAISLAVCQDNPYPQLLQGLDDDRASRILTLAGYQPVSGSPTVDWRWRRTGADPHPAKIFTASSRLAHLHCLRDTRLPDVDADVRMKVRRWPDLLDPRPNETFRARRDFRMLWDSFNLGFRYALHSYGPATAQLVLLDGLRCADLLIGTTLVEIKSGRLDNDGDRAGLIRQMLTYALLAPLQGYPVTHVAVYAARYQRLWRYPVQQFADRLAGARVDLACAGTSLAGVIRRTAHRGRAA